MFIQYRVPYRAGTKKTYPKCSAPCKGFLILEYGAILLVESRIWKILLVRSKIQDCEIRNKVQGVQILLTIGIRSSADKASGIQYKESGIHSMDALIWRDMWLSTLEIGAAQFRSFTDIEPKHPFYV